MAIIDFVRWQPKSDGSSDPLFAWKFPETNLSTYTQLIVDESKEAVLFSKGQFAGKFGPGKHTLNSENLPVIRNLFGLPFGGKNPFTAEIWFVNKVLPLNIDWSTDAMYYNDPGFGALVPIMAEGRYGLKLDDAERFLKKMVGVAAYYTASQLTDQFWGALVAKTKTTLMQFMQQQRIGIETISAYLEPLSKNLEAAMLPFWEDYGFILNNFYITSMDIDRTSEAGRKIMDAISRQSAQKIGGYTWQQSQVFEVADKAVNAAGRSGAGQGGLVTSVIATSMLGGLTGNGLLQPAQTAQPAGGTGPLPSNVTLPVRDVFCSNCAKKFSSSMKFCPHCGDVYRACPRCGADNDESAKRCVSCGTQLAGSGAMCGGCGGALPQGSAFCPQCGTPATAAANTCKRCNNKLNGEAFCPQCGLKTTP